MRVALLLALLAVIGQLACRDRVDERSATLAEAADVTGQTRHMEAALVRLRRAGVVMVRVGPPWVCR
jgi:hypothetical protein